LNFLGGILHKNFLKFLTAFLFLAFFAGAYSDYLTPTNTAISIGDNFFTPDGITIYQGDSITWTNNGYNTHTVTFDNASIDSGDLRQNYSFTNTFNSVGTYNYHCRYNSMNGIIVVENRNSNSQTCPQINIQRNDITLNENSQTNYTQKIYNNSGQNFYIDTVNAYSNNSFITVQKNNSDYLVSANSTGNIGLLISTGEVNSNIGGTISINITGHFADGTNCNNNQMNFTINVTVNNTNNTTSQTNCPQISIQRNDITLNENSQTNYTQKIYNNSGQNFYIDTVNAYSNNSFITVQKNYSDYFVSAYSTGNIQLGISTGEVNSNTSGTVNVVISGHFGDGTNCYSNQINGSFNVTVNNTNNQTNPNPPIPQPNPQGTPACADISLNTQDFVLSQNDTQYKEFFLHNYSDQFFYVDFAGIYDSVDGAYSELWKASSFVEPNSTGYVGAKVSSLNASGDVSGKGNVNLRGHFSDGTVCYQNDISQNSFNINVKADTKESDAKAIYLDNKCTGFRFDAPVSKTLPGKGELKVYVNNPLNEIATVTVSGEGLVAEPKTFYIYANSFLDKTIYVTMNQSQGEVKYYVEYKCGAFNQSTKIINGANSSNLAEKVEINASTQQNGNKYNVQVNLKNKSNETISGNIVFDIPSDWNIEGKSFIKLNPNESKVFDFNVVPGKTLDKEFNGKVAFRVDSQQIETQVKFSPSAGFGGIGAAFAILTGNALLIGFIIALFLVLAYVASMPKQKKQQWEKPNK